MSQLANRLLLLACLAILGYSTWESLRQRQIIDGWRTVNGHTVESFLTRVPAPLLNNKRGTKAAYGVDVRYAYEVDGQHFESTDWSPCNKHPRFIYPIRPSASTVRADLQGRGEKGAQVQVHYNPAHPSEAFIAEEKNSAPLLRMLILPFPVVILVRVLKRKNKPTGFWDSIASIPDSKQNKLIRIVLGLWFFAAIAIYGLHPFQAQVQGFIGAGILYFAFLPLLTAFAKALIQKDSPQTDRA